MTTEQFNELMHVLRQIHEELLLALVKDSKLTINEDGHRTASGADWPDPLTRKRAPEGAHFLCDLATGLVPTQDTGGIHGYGAYPNP